jgi:hypothetical protein
LSEYLLNSIRPERLLIAPAQSRTAEISDRARRARPPLSAAARRIADEIVAAAERIRRAPPRPLSPLARSIIEHADRIRRSRWA